MIQGITRWHERFSRAIVAALFTAATLTILSGCGSDSSQTISGRVTKAGSGLADIQLTLGDGSSDTTLTDANGKFTFADVEDDQYTLTPAPLPGLFVYIPPIRTAFINGSDASGFDFSVTRHGTMATTTHTVLLKNDGTVWAWGNNGSGQVGNGLTAESVYPPVQVLSGVKAVSAGNDFTLAVKNDGTVWAWGNNNLGQLGTDPATLASSTTPVQVNGLAGAIAVAAGVNHAVALKSDGTVWAWGNNGSGQLGIAVTTLAYRATPAQVNGLSMVTAISAGFGYTLALRTGGTVWAWGNNSNGQLGNGRTTNSTSPVQVPGLQNIMTFSAGYDHAVVLLNQLKDTSVWTWGKNDHGQLGDGSVKDRSTPVKVNGLSYVTDVAAGVDHTVIVNVDGTVWAWGNNDRGQLGTDSTTLASSATPVRVSEVSGAMAVAAGSYDTVVEKGDGSLLAWGNNSNGQLGDGTTNTSSTPVSVAPF